MFFVIMRQLNKIHPIYVGQIFFGSLFKSLVIMNIVIIANFPSRLNGVKEKGRFLYLGEMLCERGHHVEMIVSDFCHENKLPREEGSIKQEAYRTIITALHEPGYPNNISLKRLWSHFQWGRNVEKYLKSIRTPDAIYCAVPSLTAGVRISKLCQKRGIRFIIDVQDLWPEAFQVVIKNKVLHFGLQPLVWYANQIYRRADLVIAVSDTYLTRAIRVNRKTSKGYCVYLGNDGALFDEARESADKPGPRDDLWLCYIGTMGYSYDIPCVLEALSLYKRNGTLPRIKFIAMGQGPLLESFKNQANDLEINCEFTGALPYKDMVAKMCSCDIVINPIVKNAAQSITNKVGDYALSGLPVISTQENPEYRALVDEYNCGINCNVGDAKDVANALTRLANDVLLRKQMGANARKLGMEKFDRRKSYLQILKVLEDNNI